MARRTGRSYDRLMNAVVYRLVSDLRARWRSKVLLTATVAVVVGVVVTLAAGAYRTATVADRAERALGLPFDASVIQPGGAPLTDEVGALPAVAKTESYTFVFGGLGYLDSANSRVRWYSRARSRLWAHGS